MLKNTFKIFIFCLIIQSTNNLSAAQRVEPQPLYYPPWAINAELNQVIDFYATTDPLANGRNLAITINNLQPGQTLVVHPLSSAAGVFTLTNIYKIKITKQATEFTPIKIMAASSAYPVILNQSDPNTPVVEFGTNAPFSAQYIILEGLEITGGSNGVNFTDTGVNNIWVNRNHIHNVGESGAKSRTAYNAHHLYITDNDIHNTSTYGDGVHFGDDGGNKTDDSIIANNKIYNLNDAGVYTYQGNGIRIGRGSDNNLIYKNIVHHTKAVCIYFDGSDVPETRKNVISSNVIYNCGDNGIQAENGGAVVVNNLMVGPFGNKAFDSTHNAPTYLEVVSNTMIDVDDHFGARLVSWHTGQAGLKFHNNVVYTKHIPGSDPCLSGYSISLPSTTPQYDALRGNVVYGCPVENVPSSSIYFTVGTGLNDFLNAPYWNNAFSGNVNNYKPKVPGPLAGSSYPPNVRTDLNNSLRNPYYDSGSLVRSYCGDGQCVLPETNISCPVDCH